MNRLVSDQARRLAEAPPALGAAVGSFVGVHAKLVSPEVRNLLEKLAAVIAGVGTGRVNRQHHQGFGGVDGVIGGCRTVRVHLRVEALHVPLKEGLCGEAELTVGAQEDRSCWG